MVQAAEKKQQIGLLGGTFDPVHNGHLAVAEYVRDFFPITSVWFIPAARPVHKAGHGDGLEISLFQHRLAMLEIAVAETDSFSVSDIEAKRPTPSYSIETIEILLSRIGKQTDFLFIIGADAFLEIDTWKRFRELPDLVSFVIISRPDYPAETIDKVISRNYPDYKMARSGDAWISTEKKGTFFLRNMEPVPISSTDIRKRVRTGKDISGFVPPGVEEYINTHGLYR